MFRVNLKIYYFECIKYTFDLFSTFIFLIHTCCSDLINYLFNIFAYFKADTSVRCVANFAEVDIVMSLNLFNV